MPADPIRTALRMALKRRRLGDGATCVLCGNANPALLIRVTNPRIHKRVRIALLERHHTIGEANAPELDDVLCRNCHAIMHDDLAAAGVSLLPPATILDRIVNAARGLAVARRKEAALLDELASLVTGFRSALDVFAPGWQSLPEARPFSEFNRAQPVPAPPAADAAGRARVASHDQANTNREEG